VPVLADDHAGLLVVLRLEIIIQLVVVMKESPKGRCFRYMPLALLTTKETHGQKILGCCPELRSKAEAKL
jgi:hypothetical protein